jgi:hypothetical protein
MLAAEMLISDCAETVADNRAVGMGKVRENVVYRVIRIRLNREAKPLELQNPLKSSCGGEGRGVWCSLPIG